MGLKNAASHFQKVMATEVFKNLVSNILELYIDDCLVFGNDTEEFLDHLEQVFKRCSDFNVYLNPRKCVLGAQEIEFVGHTVSSEGVSFSDAKRLRVLAFPLPTTKKLLEAFLGLGNYFRDHIPQCTELFKPLRALANKSTSKVIWTSELEQEFYKVRDVIAQCPKLFFVNNEWPIHVLTDASDYGVGAYIYQLNDEGKELPILFVSKSLSGSQLNWSTIEKEAYAIVFTLQKCDHILRDKAFILLTDHRNLLYLKDAKSQKLQRWKMIMQEFDFKLGHIPGVKNIIADTMSRLCNNNLLEGESKDTSQPNSNTEEHEDASLLNIEIVNEEVIPPEIIETIKKVHSTISGHAGVKTTIRRLRERGISVDAKLVKWVREYIDHCPTCQRNARVNVSYNLTAFTRSSYKPMDIINIDTIGPLPKDKDGFEYILVLIDCFTRWIELYPIRDVSALTCAKALFEFSGRYGIPVKLRSDRGTQFVNEIIQEFTSLLGIDHEVTMAYSKQENGIVERANKEVNRHLRDIVWDKRVFDIWSFACLPIIMRILNSEVKTSTGCSPAQLLFGNAINLQVKLFRDSKLNDSNPIQYDYFRNLVKMQTALLTVAAETQLETDLYHLRLRTDDDKDSEDKLVEPGSLVLWDKPARAVPKLKYTWIGPFLVVNKVVDKVTLQCLINHDMWETHIQNVRPYRYKADLGFPTPKETAAKDFEEFFVEKIINHRLVSEQSDVKSANSYMFLVKWLGYPNQDSWEPYSYLRKTTQLHEYVAETVALQPIQKYVRKYAERLNTEK
jgi:cleavage and polyadenylation specificity factor subunit 1